mgnify:CR=1 FL=1|nr:MAG TPA: Nuclease [Caudoviricetes sp.]
MNLRYAARSEDAEQITVIEWARLCQRKHPELKLLHHVPNGGSRNKLEAIKLKQMGVLAGVADLHLPVQKGIYSGLYIEMKYDGGRLQDSQKDFLRAAAQYGNYCVVCYGATEAIKALDEYVSLQAIDTGKHENRMSVPNMSIMQDGKVKPIFKT